MMSGMHPIWTDLPSCYLCAADHHYGAAVVLDRQHAAGFLSCAPESIAGKSADVTTAAGTAVIFTARFAWRKCPVSGLDKARRAARYSDLLARRVRRNAVFNDLVEFGSMRLYLGDS